MADLINGLNIYLSQMLDYVNNNKLTVSPAKSTVTLFTSDAHEHHIHPQVKFAEQVLPLERKPKVLGVTLDTNLIFTQHCNDVAVKVQQHNNVLKALAGSTWGCDKETLLTIYQAIGAHYSATAALSGCHHLWTQTGADYNGHKIQR